MGLDMFLMAERTVRAAYVQPGPERETTDKLAHELCQKADLVEYLDGEEGTPPDVAVSVTCAQWRRAYAIHNWIVGQVQGGVDNCATYHVSLDTVALLLAAVRTVLRHPDKAEEHLPEPSSDYGGCYWAYLDYTERRLTAIIDQYEAQEPEPRTLLGVTFRYVASW